MKILVCKTFGIGNAILTIPLLKALRPLATQLDVLVGNTHDDAGALDVMSLVKDAGAADRVYVGNALLDRYDVAIEAIPYDGRWKNGVHYHADRVLDGRTRPDPSDKKWGFHTWKKHEVEYMLENARELGYDGPDPDCSFLRSSGEKYPRSVYLGMGYKKMPGDPWAIKHWGNDKFAKLIKLLAARGVKVYTTTTVTDLATTVAPVSRMAGWKDFEVCSLSRSLDEIARASVFVGNDTGMMHAAASFGIPVVAAFFMENAIVKNPPWMTKQKIFEGPDATVEAMFEKTMEFLDAQT